MKSFHNSLLYIYAFSIPFEYWDAIGLVGSFSVVKFVAILYLFLSLNRRNLFSLNNSKIFVMPLFTLFLFMTFVNAINFFILPIESTIINKALFQNIIIFWIFCNHFSINQQIRDRVLFSFLLGIILLGILYNLEIGIVFRQNRLSVFGDNPNNQGTKVAIGLILIVFFVLEDKLKIKKFRFLLLLSIPILLDFLVDSASRGALFTLFIGLSLVIILHKVRHPASKFFFIGIGILAVFFLYNSLMSNELLNKRMNEFVSEGSLGGREGIWENTIKIYSKSPVIGIGEERFRYEMVKIYNQMKSAHNYFLYILVTSGILGLIIFLNFLFRLFISALFLYREKQNIIYLVIFFVVIFAMFRSGGTLGDKSYWFFLALIAGAKIEYIKLLKIRFIK